MILPLQELPTEVSIETDEETVVRSGRSRIAAAGGALTFEQSEHELSVSLRETSQALRRITLYWQATIDTKTRYLGDHWERSYGDLRWEVLRPERVMPWYFMVFDGVHTHGYGVRTNTACFAFWRVHDGGVILNLDLRSGTVGVQLDGRTLRLVDIHVRQGRDNETPFQAARNFCAELSTGPRLPDHPVYGANDWYCHYGRNSRDSVLTETDILSQATVGLENRPYMVIDAGWSVLGGTLAGPWDRPNRYFPRFEEMAQEIRQRAARPGIWIRPLTTRERVPQHWILRTNREGSPVLDPTIPEVREQVRMDIRRLVEEWGFELVKHDFTTFDIFDLWGNEMGSEPAQGKWNFSDNKRTNAEVVRLLYQDIREAAGDALIIGCNTVGQLAVGLFEIQRIGDDTSGRAWERTRRMGVNTLAFRNCQHDTFFAADADCVSITNSVSWERNRQWMDLLAHSGTPFFASPCPDATGPEQKTTLREAFERAARQEFHAEPLDWLENSTPVRWNTDLGERRYRWNGGADESYLLRPKE